MKLYEHFGNGAFHTSVATTFGVDFDAYENIMLARFRGAGCHNNLLVADGRMLTMALEGASALPRHAGRAYTVTGARSRGVFHPKVTLQVGRRSARLLVGSANVTSAGLAGNLEVAGLLECGAEDSGERRIVASAWRFLQRFLDPDDPCVRQQIDWMADRAGWLMGAVPAEGIVTLKDGSRASLFTTGGARGIGRQFLDAISGEKPKRLVVVSPYWDEALASLRFLIDRTDVAECVLLIDRGRHFFPAHALPDDRVVKLVDYKAADPKRFVHAKVVIVQTEEADHVLYGSANCTFAALGNWDAGGLNEEASFYRAMAPGEAPTLLGLSAALERISLSREEFGGTEKEEAIPLADLATRNPGRFSCKFDILTWQPPSAIDVDDTTIELLDAEGRLLPYAPRRLGRDSTGGVTCALPPAADRPTFARVRMGNGSVTALAVVSILDLLRSVLRDARSRRIDVRLAELDGETDIGLWLIEMLNEIEDVEERARTDAAPIRRAAPVERSADPDAASVSLPYETFVAGRRLRSDVVGLDRSSLGTSDLSQIRGYLNRVLAFGMGTPGEDASTEGDALSHSFDLGDEVSDAAAALEGGFDFVTPTGITGQDAAAAERRAQRRRANRGELMRAVDTLQERVTAKAKTAHLESADILRLRAMLMITAAAGWSGKKPADNVLQVLPAAGDMDGAWPRLMGRCLFTYFGGRVPAIKSLRIEAFYDRIPDDVIEGWASCMWSIQAILLACARTEEYARSMASFRKLGIDIYMLTGLRPQEANDERLVRFFEKLNERFAKPLGLDTARIFDGHRQTARSISTGSSR